MGENPDNIIKNQPNPSLPLNKRIIYVLVVSIILLILANVILFYFQNRVSTKKAVTKESTTRTEVLPENPKKIPQVFKYELMGKKYTRVDAKIQKIIKNGTSYLAKLDSGENVTLSLTVETKLYDAYFDVDNNNKLVQVLYRPILSKNLDNLRIGEKVRVSYLDNNFSSKKAIPITEFVLLER